MNPYLWLICLFVYLIISRIMEDVPQNFLKGGDCYNSEVVNFWSGSNSGSGNCLTIDKKNWLHVHKYALLRTEVSKIRKKKTDEQIKIPAGFPGISFIQYSLRALLLCNGSVTGG